MWHLNPSSKIVIPLFISSVPEEWFSFVAFCKSGYVGSLAWEEATIDTWLISKKRFNLVYEVLCDTVMNREVFLSYSLYSGYDCWGCIIAYLQVLVF